MVKLTCGEAEPERMSQALTVAATAILSGASVSLWLTGEAVWLAVPGRAEAIDLPLSAPFAQMRDTLLELGRLTVCTQCASRRDLTPADFVAGVQVRGAASFVEEVLAVDAVALVY